MIKLANFRLPQHTDIFATAAKKNISQIPESISLLYIITLVIKASDQ
jgi:hypothetical protein